MDDGNGYQIQRVSNPNLFFFCYVRAVMWLRGSGNILSFQNFTELLFKILVLSMCH